MVFKYLINRHFQAWHNFYIWICNKFFGMKTSHIFLVSGVVLSIMLGGLFFSGCKKKPEEKSSLRVKMIDAPGDFQQVNVEVLQVKVHHEGAGWIDLPTNSGVYDLLTLQNDVSATLVNMGELPSGKLNQFRLILGNNNYVMVDSVYYPLATPSAQQSGLKINLKADLVPNQLYEVVVDFDAEQSIVTQGTGSYSLKPVLKVVSLNPY